MSTILTHPKETEQISTILTYPLKNEQIGTILTHPEKLNRLVLFWLILKNWTD